MYYVLEPPLLIAEQLIEAMYAAATRNTQRPSTNKMWEAKLRSSRSQRLSCTANETQAQTLTNTHKQEASAAHTLSIHARGY
jgi:hypothetical protein